MRLEGQFVAPWLHLTRNVDTPAMCCPPSEKLVYNKPTATSSIYPTVIGIMFTINLAYEISFKSALNPIWNPHFSSVFLVKAPCSSKYVRCLNYPLVIFQFFHPKITIFHHFPIGFSLYSSLRRSTPAAVFRHGAQDEDGRALGSVHLVGVGRALGEELLDITEPGTSILYS